MLKLVAKHIRESILLAHSHTGGERVSQKTDSPLAVLLWTNLCIAKTETVRECREDTRHHFYRVRAAQSVLCSQRKIRARANRLLAGQLPKPLSSGQS